MSHTRKMLRHFGLKNFSALSRIVSFASVIAIFATASALAQPPPMLRPPHEELPPTYWEVHGGQITLGILVGLVVVVLGIIWLRRPKIVVVESPVMLARRALEKLRARKEDGAVVMEVTQTLKRYVMSVLRLPSEELTTSEFRGALQAHSQINTELGGRLNDFLQRCDEWKFSATVASPQLNAAETALELVDKIESDAQAAAKTEVAA